MMAKIFHATVLEPVEQQVRALAIVDTLESSALMKVEEVIVEVEELEGPLFLLSSSNYYRQLMSQLMTLMWTAKYRLML